MADIINEIKQAIDRQIRRSLANDSANRGVELQPQTHTNAGQSALSGVMEETQPFGAGYDGTDTIMLFTWDVSSWDSTDVWTA